MRNVYPGREVCHLWAHQAQPSARNSNGTVYFNGATLYSYGEHYPMARMAPGFVLFNDHGYSSTTAKHRSWARSAIPGGLRVIEVPHVPQSHAPDNYRARDNVESLANSSLELMAKSARARTNKAYLLDAAARTAADARFLADTFGVDGVDIPTVSEEAARDARKAIERAERERAERESEARAKANQERREKLAEQLGIAVSELPESRHYLRVNPSNPDEVQTTGGAAVPRSHVVKAWPLIARIYASGKSWAPNGHTLHFGHYAVNSIGADGTLYVGCHEFSRAEVERFARVLEVAK